MNENEILIALWREIDRAVVANPDRRLDVAAVLAPYRYPETVGWFMRFEEWVAGEPSEHPVLPDVDDPLEGMTAVAARRGLLEEERLALAALARASPERFGPEGSERDRMVGVLQPLTRHNRRDLAVELHRRGILDQRTATFVNRRVLAMQSGADSRFPVTAISVQSRPIPGHTVAGAAELLDPARWRQLSGGVWGPMRPLDDPERPLADDEPRCFQEVFNVTSRFQLTPMLEFVRRDLAGDAPAHALEYRLCPHGSRHPGGDERVRVDAGGLVTREIEGRLHVTTTKRIAFDEPFDGPSLTMVARALGYPAAFERMIDVALATDSRSPR